MRALWRTAGRSKGGAVGGIAAVRDGVVLVLLLAARARSGKSCRLFPPAAGCPGAGKSRRFFYGIAAVRDGVVFVLLRSAMGFGGAQSDWKRLEKKRRALL